MDHLVNPAEWACEWFARCTRPSAGVVEHPVLGHLPVCQECVDMLDLTLIPWDQVEIVRCYIV